MVLRVVTHPLHGAWYRNDLGAQLIAAAGRVVAVAKDVNIDLYDAADVADTSETFGTNSCKLAFIATLKVTDITDAVSITQACFLRGGLLAVAGTCNRGTVVHVYKLAFTSRTAAVHPFVTELGHASAPTLATEALPQLVFRAALPVGSSVQLLAHPTLQHTLGVILSGDSSVRFYDCSPSSDAVVPALADCGAGVVSVPTASPIVKACLSRDGQVLVAATEEREIAVFHLLTAPLVIDGVASGRMVVSGRHHVSFVCDSDVTALAAMLVPCPPDAANYSRFRLNAYAVLSGHMNGCLSVWWCGNVAEQDRARGPGAGGLGTGRASSTGRGHGDRTAKSGTAEAEHAAGSSAPSHGRYPVLYEPLATYPPFHASRGPISHISPSFVEDEGPNISNYSDTGLNVGTGRAMEGSDSVPNVLRRMAGGAGSGDDQAAAAGSTATACTHVCVGAQGARGWRVLTFPHVPLRMASMGSRAPVSRYADPSASASTTRQDMGSWGYDSKGHRVFVPPPPASVAHLTQPYFSCPSYAQVVASPIVGDVDDTTSAPAVAQSSGATGALAATGTGQSSTLYGYPGLVMSAPAMTGPGIMPMGAVLVQRYPSADQTMLACGAGRDVATDSTTDAGTEARKLFPGLPPSSAALDRSLFRRLAKDDTTVYSMAGGTGNGMESSGLRPPRTDLRAFDLATSGPRPAPAHAWLPRTIMLLLTERGMHAVGFDFHMGLAADVRPEALAARALGFPRDPAENGGLSAGLVTDKANGGGDSRAHVQVAVGSAAPERPYFGGYAPYAVPGSAGAATVTPLARALTAPLVAPPPLPAAKPGTLAVAMGRKPQAQDQAQPPAPPVRAVVAALPARRPTLSSAAPPTVPARPKTSYPMSLTGRQDSVIRGHRAVFQEDQRVPLGPSTVEYSQAEHAMPKAAVELLNETMYSAGHGRAAKMAAAAAEAEELRRREARLRYLPRHTAARLAKQAGRAGQVPVDGAVPSSSAAAPGAAMGHIGYDYHSADVSSVDMDLDNGSVGSLGRPTATGLAKVPGGAGPQGQGQGGARPAPHAMAPPAPPAASTMDPEDLLTELSSMRDELNQLRAAFKTEARVIAGQAQQAQQGIAQAIGIARSPIKLAVR